MKQNKNKSEIQPPAEIFATKGVEIGEINLQWDSVKGASKYIVQKSSNYRKNYWMHVDIVSESNCTISSLKPNRKYVFRVASINGRGQSGWSKVISKRI